MFIRHCELKNSHFNTETLSAQSFTETYSLKQTAGTVIARYEAISVFYTVFFIFKFFTTKTLSKCHHASFIVSKLQSYLAKMSLFVTMCHYLSPCVTICHHFGHF